MKIDIITIFPQIFSGFFSESLLARAHKKKLLKLTAHDLRKWTTDKHQTVDDRPYGGGAGMVLMAAPISAAVKSLKFKVESKKTRTILLSAKGKTFTQKEAKRLAKYDQLIFICGRYEGVDERVVKYVADEEISIGNYVLFGGEVASMVIIEAVSRLLPGVIAKSESIQNESFSNWKLVNGNLEFNKEHAQYTRPEEIIIDGKKRKVPAVLLTGNHQKIKDWRNKNSR